MNVQSDRSFHVDDLRILIQRDRSAMGRAAASEVARRINLLASEKNEIRVIFAAAPSQNEFLDALVAAPEVPWDRIVAFHLDEYLGLPADSDQLFSKFLKDRLFDRVPFKAVHYLDPAAPDVQAECDRYANLLGAAPLDVACLGIGENGHLAFNDPPVADFDDPEIVKVVALDEICRAQQVHDGSFAALVDVPTHAFTVTIPVLMGAGHCSVVVPGSSKAAAVDAMLNGPVDVSCPASILRRHQDATLYMDSEASARLASDDVLR